MQTIEQAASLHREISRNAPHPGGLIQSVSVLSGWADNMEDQSMVFTSRIAPGDVADSEKRSSLRQGFGCVEVNITAKWGGCHYDGTPRTETDVTIHVLDRLAGGMAQKTWHTTGAWSAEVIADDELLPLLRKLLGQESMAAILARKNAETELQAQNQKAWLDQFGL